METCICQLHIYQEWMKVARKIAPCDRAFIHVCLAYLFLHSELVFSFYLIGFFHSETNVKSLRRSRESIFALQAPQHHHNTTVTHLCYLNVLLHSWSNLRLWLFKRAEGPDRSRSSLPRPWTPQPSPLHHPGKGWTSLVFLLYLILFFHSETDWKKELVA